MNLSPQKKPFRLSLGKRGEMIAFHFLSQEGYKIVDKNYSCPYGEIDVIVEKSKSLVFVEIKTRTSDAYGRPEEAVDLRKQQKIIQVAQWYLKARKREEVRVSFGVIGILWKQENPEIRWIPDAFEITSEKV